MRNETRISDVDMANIRRIFDEKNSDRHAKHGARWRSQFFESNINRIFDEKNSDHHEKHGARWRSQFFESNITITPALFAENNNIQ